MACDFAMKLVGSLASTNCGQCLRQVFRPNMHWSASAMLTPVSRSTLRLRGNAHGRARARAVCVRKCCAPKWPVKKWICSVESLDFVSRFDTFLKFVWSHDVHFGIFWALPVDFELFFMDTASHEISGCHLGLILGLFSGVDISCSGSGFRM